MGRTDEISSLSQSPQESSSMSSEPIEPMSVECNSITSRSSSSSNRSSRGSLIIASDEEDAAAVEESLFDSLNEMFPALPDVLIRYKIRSALILKESKESLAMNCIEYFSLSPEEQKLQLEEAERNQHEFLPPNPKPISSQYLSLLTTLPPEVDIATLKMEAKRRREVISIQVWETVNDYRKNTLGLPPLKWHRKLSEIAMQHSRNMAKKSVPTGHSGFNSRVKSLPLMCYQVGENVALIRGYKNVAKSALEGWCNSEGHKQTMLDPTYDYCGVGVYKRFNFFGTSYFITHIFVSTTPIEGRLPIQVSLS